MNEIQRMDNTNQFQIEKMSTDQALALALSITQNLLARQQQEIISLKKDFMEIAQQQKIMQDKQAYTQKVVDKYVNQGDFGGCYHPLITAPMVKRLWKALGIWNSSSGYNQPYAKYLKQTEPIFFNQDYEVNGDVRYQWRIHSERGVDLVEKLLVEKNLFNEFNSHNTVEERQKWINDLQRRQL